MSATISTSENIFNQFVHKLSGVNKKEAGFLLVRNLVFCFLVFVPLFLLLLVLEAGFNFGSDVRTAIFYIFASSFAATFILIFLGYFFRIKGIIKPFDPVEYSGKIGKNLPDIKDSLRNSLSIYIKSKKEKVFSNELIDADLELTKERYSNKDLGSFIKFTSLKKPVSILIAVFFVSILSFTLFPGELNGAFNRYINHGLEYLPDNLGIQFNILPGDTEVPKGEDLSVEIKMSATDEGYEFKKLNFFVFERTRDGMEILKENLELEPESKNVFKTEIKNITSGLNYYADYKGVRSQRYNVSISENPIVKNFNITFYPPQFTGLPSKELPENIGDLTVPEGSRVYFKIESNKELQSAGVKYFDNVNFFETNSRFAEGNITATESGEYTFYLKDIDNNEINNPKKYKLNVVPDNPPTVTIIEPEETYYFINAEREVLIRGRITDDYGFSRLTLNYRKTSPNISASGNFTAANIPIKNLNATILEVPYIWNFANLRPGRNEVIEYYLEVTDNTGKSARSESKFIQYKSLPEILKQTQEITQELQANLTSIAQDASELQKFLRESKKLNRTNEELGLNDPQRRQELQKNVENLQNTLSSTQEKIDNSLNELEKRSMLNEKTLEDYMKMQELFNKINTPELQEMLEKLREALKNNDQERARDLMQQFNFDEEQFKKNLEQIMDIMEKIENLQKLGELTQKLDDITNMQEELLEETQMTSEDDSQKQSELSDKQENLKNELSDYKEQLSDLIDKMNNMREKMDSKDLEDLLKQLQQMQTEQKMQQSSDQLQQNQKSNSEQTQQDIMSDLNKMNQDMQNALENIMQMQSASDKMMQKMQEIKKNLEELSKEQQEVRDKTDNTNSNSKEQMDERGNEQQQLQQKLSRNIDDLMNNAGQQVTPELGRELGDAYNEMGEANENLEKGNKDDASGKQGEAKQSLDNAAEMLGDMISQMQQQGQEGQDGQSGKSGKGRMGELMQQLAEIIAQQQGLAGQMGKLGQDGKQGQDGQGGEGSQYSQEQLQQMDRLKLEQQRLSEQLGNLSQDFEEERRRSGERLLGDLRDIQKQMQETVSDLESYELSRETLERQNRIISRMLDAQLSQREKDFEQRRESNPGKNFVRTSPPEIVIQGPNSVNAFKEDFLRLRKEGYNQDYEDLIARYLMELRRKGYTTE